MPSFQRQYDHLRTVMGMALGDLRDQLLDRLHGRFDDQHRFRFIAGFPFPAVDGAAGGQDIHARTQALLDQISGQFRSRFDRVGHQ